ncbi:MAG: glycerol kinase GlpK [Coriobacteriales bacterium]|jgi:glycerol kinase
MPRDGYVMAIDSGTTSSRCILFDRNGKSVQIASKGFKQFYPHPGWVEQDPMEILASQVGVMAEVQVAAGIAPEQVLCAGITNQRETTVVWDKNTGEPVYNAIVWQCRRTADYIEKLVADGYSEKIQKKTGLIPDAYFSASKICWILDNVEGARERAEAGDLLFGTIDTWLIWNLTSRKVHATDYTNASRTLLFNIHTLEWDDELLELFDIPKSMLPEVRKSSGSFGKITIEGFSGDIEITGVAGDQQAALFGQCCFEAGQAKNTYGTGCFLLMNTGKTARTSEKGLLTTIAASPDDEIRYALEGSVFIAGALIEWLVKDLGLIESPDESSDVATSIDSADGVYIVPAFTGLGTPYWDPYARGAIYGITRGTTKAHLVRAALEALAFQVYDILKTMEDESGVPLKSLKVDGKASRNDFMLQFQADILGVDIVRPSDTETTALGAAYLAGLAKGVWSGIDELEANCKIDRIFKPNGDEKKNAERMAGWRDAIARTMSNRS